MSLRASLSGFVLGALATSVAAEPAAFDIDPEHVVVGFKVDHLGFAKVVGFFTDVEGSFVFDEITGSLSDVAVSVATDSVYTGHEARDDHVRGRDFLDSREHATMTFTATDIERREAETYVIDGQLDLLGVTHPLRLEATVNKSGPYPIGRDAYAIGVSATGSLQRSIFGMNYAVDNGWVGDDVEIFIEFEARRQ